MRRSITILTAVILLACAWPAAGAVTGTIITKSVNSSGYGYAVAKVWGTDYEMGYAHGYLFATEIAKNVTWVRKAIGSRYTTTVNALATTYWPPDVQQEIQGIVAGVKAKIPTSPVNAGDLALLATFADWGYSAACRSHAAWGSYMPDGVAMLATRRLDRNTPTGLVVLHLLLAYDRADGHRWLNISLPGVITAATAVRNDGTLVSIHDAPESGGARARRNVITRSMATRTLVTATNAYNGFLFLGPYKPWTGTFLNVYSPQYPAVIAADETRGFYNLRIPQPSYFGGEVIHTSNLHTDGTFTPTDFPEVAAYYSGATPKTMADHFGLLNHVTTHDGFQLLSVAYRAPGDMTLWYQGRLSSTSTTPILALEWSSLFGE